MILAGVYIQNLSKDKDGRYLMIASKNKSRHTYIQMFIMGVILHIEQYNNFMSLTV